MRAWETYVLVVGPNAAKWRCSTIYAKASAAETVLLVTNLSGIACWRLVKVDVGDAEQAGRQQSTGQRG